MNAISRKNRSGSLAIYIHIIVWVLICVFPMIMDTRNAGVQWTYHFRRVAIPLSFCVVFYTNFCLLVPHYLFKKENTRYALYNALLILGVMAFMQLWYFPHLRVWDGVKVAIKHTEEIRLILPPRVLFLLRDLVFYIFTAGLGAVIRMSTQWQKAEAARKEAEQNQVEAELNNLRNQLNPHFLLNTLNNIYALITFDTDKAQQAVQDLSKLLRHVLYENQETFVPLYKEMDFIRNYIDLMRIRLVKGVKVDIQIDVREDSNTPIAPLIFISLIENAFKHGISPTEPSFISISIRESKGHVRCEILNSNHPKNQSDKSGSGIGLEQVSKRLELLYPHKYVWKRGVTENGTVYSSALDIQTK